jgi:hypothetical protein
MAVSGGGVLQQLFSRGPQDYYLTSRNYKPKIINVLASNNDILYQIPGTNRAPLNNIYILAYNNF